MDIGWYKDNTALQAELKRDFPAVAELIEKLEQQLSRYQGAVEVDGVWKQDGILFYPLPTAQLEFNQKVRVLVMKEVE